MNLEKTGKFISRLRRERQLTQRELADKIGVTDKAVSKWENGRGFPDVGILEALAKELNTSVTEIMNGEKSAPENLREQSDSAILDAVMYVKAMSRKTIGIILTIFGAFLSLTPLYGVGAWTTAAFAVGILMLTGGVLMIVLKKSNRRLRLSGLAAGLLSLAALLAAIVLEALPYGAVLRFALGPNETKDELFSYFSLIPFGYANLAPLITAVLTVLLAIFSVVLLFVKNPPKGVKNALFIALAVTAVISVCPVLYGRATAVGVVITIVLAAAAFFRAAANSAPCGFRGSK